MNTKSTYFIIIASLSLSLCAYAGLMERTIRRYANKDIHISRNSRSLAKVGYGNCDFLRNGEETVVATFIKQNDVVVDAGAHVGGWTKSVLSMTDGQCSIYAFEPVPDSYNQLKELTKQYKNVVNFNLGLGKEDAILEMNYFFQRGSDCSTLYTRPDLYDVPVRKIQVGLTYLDKIAREHNIQHIDFLKIDTEGAEFDVLMGANDLITNNKIDIIQFEYGGTYPDANITLLQVYNYLTSNEYLIFRIIPKGLIYIEEWTDELENFQYSNYLAVKKAL